MFQYGQLSNALFYVAAPAFRRAVGLDGPEPEPDPEHEPHDAAQLDPEREWQRGHVYVCTIVRGARPRHGPEGAARRTD